MNIPLHLKLRRIFNSSLNKFLALLFPVKASTELLDINEMKSIALIRPNYRIGNIIFLTPLINEIAIQNPHIKIDLFIGSATVGKVVQPMPNIDTIIDISRKILINPLQLYKFVQQIRHKKYDLCINISSRSLSSQLVTLFIKSKFKLSFEDEKSWVPITHKVPHKWIFSHASLQPLEVLEGFGITSFKHPKLLDIKLTQEELDLGKTILNSLKEKYNIPRSAIIISIFRNARYDKKLSDEWWLNFISKLKQENKNIYVIDILSPDIPSALSQDVIPYSNSNLRILGAFFKACDLYISADTGPMHLSAASGANTIGLFNKTIIAAYGSLGDNNLNIDIDKIQTDEVIQKILKHLQKVI